MRWYFATGIDIEGLPVSHNERLKTTLVSKEQETWAKGKAVYTEQSIE
jgi:hypothetical protein